MSLELLQAPACFSVCQGLFAEWGGAEGLPLPNRLLVRQHGLACRRASCTPRPDGNGSVAATLKPADGALCKQTLVFFSGLPTLWCVKPSRLLR